MSNDLVAPNNSTIDKSTIVEADVVDFLREHPDFLLRQTDILTDLELQAQTTGVVSLTQIQLDQYREKVKRQKKQLDTMVVNAKRNEHIYTTYAELNFHLSTATTRVELEGALQHHLMDTLGLADVTLQIVNKLDESQPTALSQRSILDKKLAKSDYYFGRLGKHERQMLFTKSDIGSVALIRLKHDELDALLAIASDDPLHFTPDMDTTLLDYLKRFCAVNMHRVLHRDC